MKKLHKLKIRSKENKFKYKGDTCYGLYINNKIDIVDNPEPERETFIHYFMNLHILLLKNIVKNIKN